MVLYCHKGWMLTAQSDTAMENKKIENSYKKV